MKKIYLFALAGIMMLSAKFVSAQNEGCIGTPVATNNAISSICVVFVNNFPANSLVVLLDVNLAIIGSKNTDFSGFATITFPCDKTPFRVAALTGGDCSVPVPPQAPLPIKLSSFNAELKSDNSVGLKWVSSLELSSFKYVVQKSNDGLNFSDIGNVAAAGNSNRPLSYSFLDPNFVSGASYFRLKQVDIDGKVEYSKVVYVNNKSTTGIITKVSPNPFVSDVQLIGISSSELNSRNVQVYNSFGQRINYRINGSNSIEIDASAARGVYILKVKAQTFKLIKN